MSKTINNQNEMEKEFKGTKGEWYHEFTSFSQFSPNGHSIIKAGKVGTPVAVLPMPIGGVNSKERNISNAQLIVTAPELLKALQTLVELQKNKMENGKWEGYVEERMKAWENAEKVINKALDI